MPVSYKNNHYVPQWYQSRFVPPGQQAQKLYYLDLKPETWHDPRGVAHVRRALNHRGFKDCFAEDDLYTLWRGEQESRAIETLLFGKIDSGGKRAVDYFTDFAHPSIDYKGFQDMMTYMSAQKLRTPKGLDWLASVAQNPNPQVALQYMVQYRNLFCAIWTECIWQIADATDSATKFIISDHPITVYNRECGPRNKKWCRGANDPDIRLHGTHTIFPLTLDKVLILTNLSWVRNPYQSAVAARPNPNFFRPAIFKFMEVQTLRHLSEEEVRQINFVTKSRAYRYVAAGEEDWLYPERHISKSDWNTYGEGYLFMPDPRPIHYGGQILMGYSDGSAAAFDEYGRRPWEEGYNDPDSGPDQEATLYRFQGEFARRFGPNRRGRTFQVGQLDNERDSDDFHQYHLGLDKKKAKR